MLKRIVFACGSLAAVILAACSSSPAEPQVTLGNQVVNLELAMTQAEQTQGLSGRNSLPRDEGMLFIYKTPGFYKIWMPNMHFSIDVLWINSKGVVQHIERGMSPETYPHSFSSPYPSQYILEVNAGVADQVKVGDMVYFENIPMLDDLA